jgi:pimeloyl-ACP methyl ester carboxylesterase
MSHTTYFIGGIGTDRQLYRHQLQHIPDSKYLSFPQHEEEDTMEIYIRKFIPSIDTSKPFNIVGCSMGGIMTMALLKHIHPEKVILISSVKCRKEMPWRLKQLKYSRLHKLLPGRLFIKGVATGSYYDKELKAIPGLSSMVASMAQNNSPRFLSWCVNAIVNWDGKTPDRNDIIHIHGTKDGMFPIKRLQQVIPVPNGSHKMLLSNPAFFTDFLLKQLNH